MKVMYCTDCDDLTSWSRIKLCGVNFYLCDSCGNLVRDIKMRKRKVVPLGYRRVIMGRTTLTLLKAS